MNKTALFLTLAAALALVALVLGPTRTRTPDPGGGTGAPLTQPPRQEGPLSLDARLSHPVVETGTSEVFLTVDLRALRLPGSERAPVNLALVIDRSGSMNGEPLANAKRAARHLITQLHERDRLAIVHYGSDVRSLPSLAATSANRERMLTYVDGIWDEGATNIGEGLIAGRDQLLAALGDFRSSRLILISDGQPTVGLTDPGSLLAVARELRGRGVSLSAIGVGAEFNEDLMQGLAELGGGAYAYLREASQLASLFTRDLDRAATTVAREVVLTFQLPEQTRLEEVLGYRSHLEGQRVTVPLADFAAGQLEQVVARLSVRAGAVGSHLAVAEVTVAYRDLLAEGPGTASAQLSASVTDRREEVLARQDREATVIATRAQSAQNTVRAAEALGRGDREEARRMLQSNRALFGAAAAIAGEAAVQEDLASQHRMEAEMASARSPEQVKDRVKAAKRKARQDFGKVGSTY